MGRETVERAQPQYVVIKTLENKAQSPHFTPDTQPKTTEYPVGGLLIQWHCVGPL